MSVMAATFRGTGRGHLVAFALAPASVVFLSSNIVNAGNLAFNVVFSRWMGPDLFGALALLLTIKLALLGVMSALQMAVTEKVAATPAAEDGALRHSLAFANRRLVIAVCIGLLPVSIGLAFAGDLFSALNLPGPHLFLLLLAAVPFGASLSALRGIAFGRMNTPRIVASGQVEMLVRLGGAVSAWFLGFGMEGVVIAISLSIVAGWAVLANLLPSPGRGGARDGTLAALAIGALPFGVLQLAQVIALDGDIFLAKAILPAEDAGYIAALPLFQRIQFFACFAIASVLLPGVVIASRSGKSLIAPLLPAAALFCVVSVPVLIAAIFWPAALIRLLVGPDYVAAAPALAGAITAAAFFTSSYLAATLLAALRDRSGIAVLFAVAVGQFGLMWVLGPDSLEDLILIKVLCQLGAALVLSSLCVLRIRQRAVACLPLVQ